MKKYLAVSEKIPTFATALKTMVDHPGGANGNRSSIKVSHFYGLTAALYAYITTAAVQKDLSAHLGAVVFNATGRAAVPYFKSAALNKTSKMAEEFEIWKGIEGYEGRYQVSNLGRVKSFCGYAGKRVRIRKTTRNKKGYEFVCLSHGTSIAVHRLVAKAFVPGYKEGLTVNHIDENPSNNRWDNLEWMTSTDNANYGTARKRSAESQGVPVAQIDKNGVVIAEYTSQSEAARATNIPSPRISMCCCGKIKTAGGFLWKRIENRNEQKTSTPKIYRMKSSKEEKWADIEGYEGLYQISSIGRVYALSRMIRANNGSYTKKGHFLKWKFNKEGYPRVVLRKDGKDKYLFVHRIVAKAFVAGYNEGLVVNHKDENRANPCASNLEWITGQENNRYGNIGVHIGIALGKPVYQISLDGEIIRRFNSVREAARFVNGNDRDITRCCRGLRGMTKHHGYKWAYAEKQNENE